MGSYLSTPSGGSSGNGENDDGEKPNAKRSHSPVDDHKRKKNKTESATEVTGATAAVYAAIDAVNAAALALRDAADRASERDASASSPPPPPRPMVETVEDLNTRMGIRSGPQAVEDVAARYDTTVGWVGNCTPLVEIDEINDTVEFREFREAERVTLEMEFLGPFFDVLFGEKRKDRDEEDESINITTPNNTSGGKKPHDENKRDNASMQPTEPTPNTNDINHAELGAPDHDTAENTREAATHAAHNEATDGAAGQPSDTTSSTPQGKVKNADMFSVSDGTPRSTDRPRDTGSHTAMWTPKPVEETNGGSESTTEGSDRTALTSSEATEKSGGTTEEAGEGGGTAADTPGEKEGGEKRDNGDGNGGDANVDEDGKKQKKQEGD